MISQSGVNEGLDTSTGVLKYKQIYDAGDAIKFTPLSAPGLAPSVPTEKYSKTSVGVKVDDETVAVDQENNYLKRVNYYKAADGIEISATGDNSFTK